MAGMLGRDAAEDLRCRCSSEDRGVQDVGTGLTWELPVKRIGSTVGDIERSITKSGKLV